jgi:hypothetical protein
LVVKVLCNLIFGVADAPADPGEAEPAALTLSLDRRGRAVERFGDLFLGHEPRQT